MKTCTICKIEKPLDSFYVAKRCLDGHHGQCKSCMNKRSRDKYVKFSNKKFPNKCVVCEKEFLSYRKKCMFCSPSCRSIGKNNPNWRGGKKSMVSGYVLVYSPNHPNKDTKNYVLEHRIVMEESIGRYLMSEEVVHHIDGNKNNNKIENLRLFKNQSDHSIYHMVNK